MATSIGCAGLGLAMDSTAVAASGAVAATVGMVAQRSAGRRLRRRLRQERARNRLELHDLEIRLEQATRHLAEAVALAEAATRAMSGAPLVLTAEGAVVAKTLTPAAQAALVAQPVAAPVVEPAAPVAPVAVPEPARVVVPAAEADTEVIEAVPAAPALPAAAAEPEGLDLPVLPRRVAAAAVSEHLKDAARVNAEVAGRVAARLADPVFGQPVVPATPADLFTPANGLPVAGAETDDAGWFAPRRSGNGLPPAPLSPAVGISLPVSSGPMSGSGMPPGQREPVSGALTLVGAEARATRLPARLADARVVDLSTLAHPESSGLIVVRRGGRHAAPPVAADHVA
ncbi:hypothetical protein [Kineosporia sp. A_224]|uniref:hypothetical protein n=1 Tax=Kineosporia sp. A_224 TaxID=1962180 RepID=UPI000B4A9317|nr:hypothetical protein [Kineosporia sp. A_224]